MGAQQVRRSRTLLTAHRARLSRARAAATTSAEEPVVLDRVAALLICRWSMAAARRAQWRALVFGIEVGGAIEAAGYPGVTGQEEADESPRTQLWRHAGAFAGAALDAHPLAQQPRPRTFPRAQGIARRG